MVSDLEDVPWELWFIFITIFLFGLVLPFLVSQAVIKILKTLENTAKFKYNVSEMGYLCRLGLGWLVLLPLYIWGVFFFKGHVYI